MLRPLLTLKDETAASEGSIDPLGMYSVADALAVRLVPGLRERMLRPRFLTATAVSLSLCGEFPEETYAADGLSEPWQVFEWYVVEGLVRKIADRQRLRGVPGTQKAASALSDRVPLSASRYLKSPAVVGFHGVYALLARALDIETAGRLGETGYELVRTWADEQGLTGFVGSGGGAGAAARKQLADAVKWGLKRGAVARTGGWSGWRLIAGHLAPDEIGRREARVIANALRDPAGGYRGAVIEFLISREGQTAYADTEDERALHAALVRNCDRALKPLLGAIMAYESFARLLDDAFQDCLVAMARTRMKTSPADLARTRGVVRASERAPELFGELLERLYPFGVSVRFQESFQGVAERTKSEDWAQLLVEHHHLVQQGKPPNGKAPWFTRFDDGSCMIGSAYASRAIGGQYDRSYVHNYRTGSLQQFARDLGMVR